jgi:antitoxin component of MazEF toxin-antitoxin module
VVNVTVRDGSLIITPVHRVRGGLDLRELIRHIPKDYKPQELEWGGPVGREVW